MPDDPRIQALVEKILEESRTPEEVCHDCPELLSRVQDIMRRLRAVEDEVRAMFPPDDDTSAERGER